MLFYPYDEGCSRTHVFVKIGFGNLVLLSLCGLFLSVHTFRSKWKDSRQKNVASVTTSGFSVVGDISSVLLCTSNFLRAINLGDEDLENNKMNAISISILGMSTIFCCLNVGLLWVDLSIETKSPRNLKQSKRVLFAIGLTYVISFVVSYAITKQVMWWFILGLIYTSVVILLLRKGCLKISEALRATTVGKRRAMEGFINVKSKEPVHCVQSQSKKQLVLERRLEQKSKSCAKKPDWSRSW